MDKQPIDLITILDAEPSSYRWVDAVGINWSLFGWLVGLGWLLVILALVIRVMLKLRRTSGFKETKIDKSFSTYRPKRINLTERQ